MGVEFERACPAGEGEDTNRGIIDRSMLTKVKFRQG